MDLMHAEQVNTDMWCHWRIKCNDHPELNYACRDCLDKYLFQYDREGKVDQTKAKQYGYQHFSGSWCCVADDASPAIKNRYRVVYGASGFVPGLWQRPAGGDPLRIHLSRG